MTVYPLAGRHQIWRLPATLTGITFLGLVFTGCDSVIEYTVDNQTAQHLTTRAVFEEDCAIIGGRPSDYLSEEKISPRSRFEYAEIYGAGIDAVSCVQVLDSNRRLVLAEKYREGKIYTLTEPLAPTGEPAPDTPPLPDHEDWGQLKEDIAERPFSVSRQLLGLIALALFAIAGLLLLVVAPLAGLIIGLFVVVRSIWRRI
jgi:hypothetical protein